MNTLIPKRIYTAWLSKDGSMPELIQRCIDSQKSMCERFGYEFTLITLENIYENVSFAQYLQDALDSPHPAGVKYCKATDYLRFAVLFEKGGIFLDSDCRIIDGKSFDELLSEKMFIGLEMADWANGRVVLGTAVLGAQKGHKLLAKILEKMQGRFSGSDSFNYESSMALLNEHGVMYQSEFKLLDPDFFYPKNSATGELKITDRTICVHEFTKLWTPEVQQSTLQKFKYNIENNINFTFVKRGDGELACMNGEVGGNCDGHPYSKELGDKLREAYKYLEKQPNTTIVEFDDQKNYNVLLHRTDSNLKEVSDFYKAISDSKRLKYFIGPDRLDKVAKMLVALHIVIPEVNMFSQYDSLLNLIKNESYQIDFADENAIFIFCAGMPAKGLIADLHKTNPNATYIDCGSAFDPAVSETRTWQISKAQFWNLYKMPSGVLFNQKEALEYIFTDPIEEKKTEVVNNFNLPQETHPERLWAMDNIGQPKDKVIFDLGCGANKTTFFAKGVDIRDGITDYCADIHCLANITKGNTVDIIISKHSLEHLIDPAKAINEWIRVLKPGGKMVIVLPDHEYINTIDPYYSAGQHLHAYTRESFANFISLFPELIITKQETVLENWSFGTVIFKLPTIMFLIPHIEGSREDGLKKCLKSISALNYPKHLIDKNILSGDGTVPEKIKWGVEQYSGGVDYFVYAANDMEFDPDSLLIAVTDSLKLGKGLVSFNEGELLKDLGNICTHFLVKKELISKLDGGMVFHTDFFHCSSDNYLYSQAFKMNEFHYSENAKIIHNHFSKGATMDATYERGWKNVEQDRETLRQKLLTLEGK